MNECMVVSTSVALTKDIVLEDGSSSKDIIEPDQSTIHVSTKLLAQTAQETPVRIFCVFIL